MIGRARWGGETFWRGVGKVFGSGIASVEFGMVDEVDEVDGGEVVRWRECWRSEIGCLTIVILFVRMVDGAVVDGLNSVLSVLMGCIST
jgi:hypothetical protein